MEKKIIVSGKEIMSGEIKIQGAKNSSLLLIACSILTNDELILRNIPNITDIFNMIDLLQECGVKIDLSKEQNHNNSPTDGVSYEAKMKYIGRPKLSEIKFSDKAGKIRTSIILLGPLLSRGISVILEKPGGCNLNLGTRAIDMHIDALTKMGATITINENEGKEYVFAQAPKSLQSIDYTFRQISVTATANVIMAASLANGSSILRNIAIEPEIVNLIEMLKCMGAQIEFISERTVSITGVQNLRGTKHDVILDRIEAGTYMILAAAIGEKVKIHIDPSLVKNTTETLRLIGASIKEYDEHVEISRSNLRAINLKTGPYPEFSTDLQPQLVSILCIANGKSEIEETMFDNRFHHVNELKKMGASITLEKSQKSIGSIIHINGVSKLTHASVDAHTLRDAAAMVIAGLISTGETHINNIENLHRGYGNLVEKLKSCKMNIKYEEV
ncbi:UDP-N-acetylglucosamine 1-carboxyvinyltransferase [Candidatus Gromoviella agglomerans]|uniref:UDP-N-acetylglucosamine 1-carboxyvinyltransferase n=1 Tax=Candidatus Gromoviella agglomerans TaxID=2806609 RepID=UPI001E5DCFCE|nr:UDP-N-acetylglucosamine 1-carboxyvinyltransferase [Candidatus Gromoviella agglomerans]UFX98288.1 UDP-N-acetylglucosamine 1-carboxyvinyltransferase [Candidatus Gromoviella agglomerans]